MCSSRCSPARVVELTSFQLQDIAYGWYETLPRSRLVGSPSLLWVEFYNMFLERFLLNSLRETKALDFELLKQSDGMSVMEYDAMFNKLAKYALHLVATDNMKAERFVNGLKDYLFKVVPVSRASAYSDVLDAVLRFEARTKERQVDREPRKKAKKGKWGPRQISSGGFCALSSIGTVGREQSNQPKGVAQTSTPSEKSGVTFY